MVPGMDRIITTVGGTPITLEMLLYGAGLLCAVALADLLILVAKLARARAAVAETRRIEAEGAGGRGGGFERQRTGRLRGQYERNGRMQTMAEIFGTRTSDLARLVNDRLDAQGQRVGQAIQDTSTKTTGTLGKLAERLAVIDR